MEPKPVNLKTRERFQFHALKTRTYLVYSEGYNNIIIVYSWNEILIPYVYYSFGYDDILLQYCS